MRLFKKFHFWFPLFYTFIGILNLLGYDDKNLLLFFTSPPFWITEEHWFVVTFTHPANIPLIVVFIGTLIFWYFFGRLIDFVIKKIKRKFTT